MIPVASFTEAVDFSSGQLEIPPHPLSWAVVVVEFGRYAADYGTVKGQDSAKRAVTVAAAGVHHLLDDWLTRDWRMGRHTSRAVRTTLPLPFILKSVTTQSGSSAGIETGSSFRLPPNWLLATLNDIIPSIQMLRSIPFEPCDRFFILRAYCVVGMFWHFATDDLNGGLSDGKRQYAFTIFSHRRIWRWSRCRPSNVVTKACHCR